MYKKKQHQFLSCDWGTSTFRLRLIDAFTNKIEAEITTDKGIAATYADFKSAGKGEEERTSFYLTFLQQQITALEKESQIKLAGIPLLISGMASSSIGLKELPYKELPFAIDGSDLIIDTIATSSSFSQLVYLVSGVRSNDDVMRGEETKMIGCANDKDNGIYLLPGTHCKHIEVNNGQVTAFSTYMTGEFFEWLSAKSILSNSVEKGAGLEDGNNKNVFKQGVLQSKNTNLLNNSFLVRTRYLLQQVPKTENYFYLSGLCIGTEINALLEKKDTPVTLVSKAALKPLYTEALRIATIPIAEQIDGDEALIKGHAQLYKRLMR